MTDLRKMPDQRWLNLLVAARNLLASRVPNTTTFTAPPVELLADVVAAFDEPPVDLTQEQIADLMDRSPWMKIDRDTLVATIGSPTGYILIVPDRS
jgi:hypothetical protein